MASTIQSDASALGGELPDELYIEFVNGLLSDAAPVLLSALTATSVEIVNAVACRSTLLLATCAAQPAIAAIRLFHLHRLAKLAPSRTVEVARRHETAFAIGACASLAAISLWTLLSFYVTREAFTQFLGATMTIAYAFGMLSRSYAIYRGFNLQLVAAFLPLSAAMFVAGGWYPVAIIVAFVPLIAFMKGYSSRLKANFLGVVAAQQKAAMLAARLDTALNNMSHGLCMIDADGRLILANDQFRAIFRLSEQVALAGESVHRLFRQHVKEQLLPQSQFSPSVRALFRGADIASDVTVPIDTKDGRAIEATVNHMKNNGTVLVVQDVTERRNAAARINRMAHFDAVTELPNRRSFEEELAKALEPGRPLVGGLTVMFLDLDNFKQVNDSLGHATGDKLLAEIARRLSGIVGSRDLVARWGGDEFVILHRHAPGLPETSTVARRIIEEIGRAVVIDGSEVIVGASIGAASAPDDGTTPDALLSKADIALYAAKADGRRRWRAFEREMDTKIQVRRLIELELRAAVANEAIDLHFQPIVDVRTRRIVSFEALARWRHPVRGAVSPGEFIPIVEEMGFMEEFGACVLRHACEACASWPKDVSVSVNLSPSQFRNGNIEAIVADVLRASDLRPDRLDLEITESTLLDDRGDARRTLEALRARGCRVSLDDFGTGYSSLSYLLSFPLDRVKIDRSFTIGLGIQERASILVESVAAMSRKLGMTVLIEGVETERQMRIIEQLGTISEVQGFLFSPPIARAQALALLGAGQRPRQAAAA
jgi:diguanylate cyclase (GGDEF)-like protein